MNGTAYAQLAERFRRIGAIGEARSVLHWDSAAVMPSGGAAARAEQLATLKVLEHEFLTDPVLPELLAEAEAEPDLDPWRRANLREMRREWAHANAVPANLVERHARACAECEQVWRSARPADDYAAVRPFLQTVLDLTRAVAGAKAAALCRSPYEALLDSYEPDGTTAVIDALFDELAGFLPALVAEAIEAQAARPAPVEPEGPFPVETQRKLCVKLMERLGFDFAHGRLDVSLHPFCGGTPDDVRITTRYDAADFRGALMGVLHETGHALYERGLPEAWRRQPVGRARGMAMHESQSLLMEMQACRSREFMEFLAPLLREAFGGTGPAWEAANLYRLNTAVRRSLIRVDADEVTYPAHVILRYRLERRLLDGTLGLADLPAAWRAEMAALLGVAPADDRHGCLQDIHWYDGAFGYFPTYTIGAIIAAQLFAAARTEDPAILSGLAKGDFVPLTAWLRRHVHGRASLLPTQDLIVAASGAPLNAAVFRRHLTARYMAA